MTLSTFRPTGDQEVPSNPNQCQFRDEKIVLNDLDITYCGYFNNNCFTTDDLDAKCDGKHYPDNPYPVVVQFDESLDR